MIFTIGISISFFLAFILVSKQSKTLADKILATWLIVIGLHIGLYYIFKIDTHTQYPQLFGIAFPFPLLHGPFLFLYTMALTHPSYFRSYRWLWHFAPAAGIYMYLIPFFSLSSAEKLKIIENQGAGYEKFNLFNITLIIASGFVYVIWISILLRNHKRNITQQFSNTERINLSWLQYLIYCLCITWLFVALGNDDWIFSAASLFVLFIGYFGIKQVGIFTNTENLIPLPKETRIEQYSSNIVEKNTTSETNIQAETIDNEDIIKKKYQKSGLSEEQATQLQKTLSDIMAAEKLYKNPELTLADLATRLRVHPNYLSQVINEKEGVNFYDYVNTLRIEEFKKQVALPENKQYTMLTIAYDCGFNSKSSFNRYFKKMTDLSPSEYLRSLN